MNKLEKIIGLVLLLACLVVSIIGLSRKPFLGAYIDSGQVTTFTDVNVDNDLVVDGILSTVDLNVSDDLAITSDLDVTGESNVGVFIQGGAVATSSSATTTSLTAAQVCNNSYLAVTPSVASALKLPVATSTIADCMPKVGDTKELLISNEAGSAINITITTDTGVELLEPSGGDVVIEQNEWALLRLTNLTATTQAAVVTSIQDAD